MNVDLESSRMLIDEHLSESAMIVMNYKANCLRIHIKCCTYLLL